MPTTIPPVRFHLLKSFTLPQRRYLQAFIRDLVRKERKKLGSIDYIFCSDEYLLEINKEFLKHDGLTDIITFELSEDKNQIVGEIYISIDRIRENAKLFKTSFLEELHRVMFHGALHLCGYKDKNPAEKKLMRKKENQYLKLIA